jgi:hypothetical protein
MAVIVVVVVVVVDVMRKRRDNRRSRAKDAGERVDWRARWCARCARPSDM